MFFGINLIPWVARHNPAFGGFVFQNFQVLGLARQQGHHGDFGENAALIAFTHQLGQIGAKGHIENGVGFALHQRTQAAACINFAKRRPLFTHKFHIGSFGFQQLFETGHSTLAILVIGCQCGPTLGRHLGRLFHQHGRLHVRTGAQTEGISIAFVPNQGIG